MQEKFNNRLFSTHYFSLQVERHEVYPVWPVSFKNWMTPAIHHLFKELEDGSGYIWAYYASIAVTFHSQSFQWNCSGNTVLLTSPDWILLFFFRAKTFCESILRFNLCVPCNYLLFNIDFSWSNKKHFSISNFVNTSYS